jgi:hypothetical protein
MEQVKIQIEELPEIKIRCKFCGCQECEMCNTSIKKERIRSIVFISGAGVSMVGLSVGLSSGLGFISLGLSFGTILSLFV